MPSLTPEKMIQYNKQGLFPCVTESEQAYVQRAHFCLNLVHELESRTGTELPFDPKDRASEEVLREAYAYTRPLYDSAPDWIPIFFNDYKLSLWHGGCAWIFQLDEDTPTSAFMQLRSSFKNNHRYLGLYNREELIAHELAHAGRMMYQDPQFEEILAYQTSPSFLRRWLGPIVQSSNESLLFILVLGFIIMANVALLAFNPVEAYSSIKWFIGLPLLLVTCALARLSIRHLQLKKCIRHLSTLYHSSTKARHLTYRLHDQDIRRFAASSSEQIRSFIEDQPSTSFYWSFIKTCYPF